MSKYESGKHDALCSDNSTCYVCKPIYELENEEHDRENFFACYICRYIIPNNVLEHWCTPKTEAELSLKESKFSRLAEDKIFPSNRFSRYEYWYHSPKHTNMIK